jgi:hypothetical protein
MDSSDPDGFTEQRRREIFLRLVAMQSKHERDVLEAMLTPFELAEHDLAGMVEFVRAYEAGETAFPVTESNTRAAAQLIEQLRARVAGLRGTVTDPRQEPDQDVAELLNAAAEGLPFAPRAIHDPVRPIEDEPGGTTHDVLFCPDCLSTVISAKDNEIERIGIPFRICWDLHGRRLPDDIRPCHASCLIACGRRSKLTAAS